ncbi:MAG: Crp/Fnr family transcriptional regulator [Pseudobdellovibrionaceae bacterium]
MEWKELWAEMPVNIKEQFESQSRTIELKRGDSVYHQGDSPQGLYFVEKGLVGLVLLGATSGKEYLLRFFRQGQFFGHRALFSEEGYHGSTKVLEPTLLKLVPKNNVLAMIEKEPFLLRGVVRVLSKELRRCETRQVMILENQTLVRTAQALVYLKDLDAEHNWTRQEIANFCASTTSTMIKALAELEALGFIQQEGRAIQILNRDGLIALQDNEFI